MNRTRRQREKPKTEDNGYGEHHVDCPLHKPASQQITKAEEDSYSLHLVIVSYFSFFAISFYFYEANVKRYMKPMARNSIRSIDTTIGIRPTFCEISKATSTE